MGWTVWGLNYSMGARFSAPAETHLVAHPASRTMGTVFLSKG